MAVNDYRNQVTTELFEIKEGPDPSSATYIFGNEDHTLGNALRHVLMNRKETTFCGYSVPHPYEPKMNVRLQVGKDHTAIDVLQSGLNDLEETANLIDDVFCSALKKFDKQKR
jgi:DNA-directed RNA polymerases I and III subunit RPAC2